MTGEILCICGIFAEMSEKAASIEEPLQLAFTLKTSFKFNNRRRTVVLGGRASRDIGMLNYKKHLLSIFFKDIVILYFHYVIMVISSHNVYVYLYLPLTLW